jgi:hypothetical protein
MYKKLLVIGIASGLLAGVIPASALAATKTEKATVITVSPASQQISLGNEDQHEFEFKITNNRLTPQTLQLTTADFNALEDSGGLIFIGTNPTEIQKKYGLAHWISLPQTSVTIPRGQTAVLKAQILNLPDLTPGGHYGAIMVKDASGKLISGQNNIGLSPISSILLFVNKTGGDIHSLRLTVVTTSHNPFNLPGSVNLRFYNSGNTHLIPRGVVSLTSPSGKLVRRGVINQSSSLVLPEDFRVFPVSLSKISSAYLPGKYKLTVAFRYDGTDQFRVYQSDMWVLLPFGVGLAELLFFGAITIGGGWWVRNNLTSWEDVAGDKPKAKSAKPKP